MAESNAFEVKSSNEILSELFGAFNAEPPEVVDRLKTHSEGDDSDSDKIPKKHKHKHKHKKTKKKHKSKSKKHKKKRSRNDSSDDSDSSEVKKKKKKKHKEKKAKKMKRLMSPRKVNIALSVNQVPMALEIMLDGTVGIKGEDGVIKKITYDSENQNNSNDVNSSVVLGNSGFKYYAVEAKKTDDVHMPEENRSVNSSKMLKVFESKTVEQSENRNRGKIQIRDLKFSSVYQETVRAVEERRRENEKRKADIEEGELSDSSGSEQRAEYAVMKDRGRGRGRYYSGYQYRSYVNYDYGRMGMETRGLSRHARARSSSTATSRSTVRGSSSRYRSQSGYSRELSGYRRHRSRSRTRSRDYDSPHYSRGRKRSRKNSSPHTSHKSRSKNERRSSSYGRSREKRIKFDSSHRHDQKNRSRTKSKERTASVEKIDKEKLLAIARKNALKLIDAGIVPGSDKLTTIKAGGKTVNELTEYCKKLSKKEASGTNVRDPGSESSDDDDKLFHHPFQVREKPSSIVLNIKNSVPLPVKSLQEKAAEQSKLLRLQFPVSSGTSHRRSESEWVPVSPKKAEIPETTTHAQESLHTVVATDIPPNAEVASVARIPQPLMSCVPDYPHSVRSDSQQNHGMEQDISTIVSKRLHAMRRLQENPNDARALDDARNAQQEMRSWSESKQDSGLFTGSTGAKILTPTELKSGAQAWAKRAQLMAATPVSGGMGMTLLQKMGWQPGEGLGKNKEGTLEPLKLEVKMDKKGLVASDETKKMKKLPPHSAQMFTFKPNEAAGKHPVSLLNELCSRKRYGVPQFDLCFECGPDHKKNFLFKVKVNGIEYKPTVASPNKKQAKAEAASACLKALGVISTTTTT